MSFVPVSKSQHQNFGYENKMFYQFATDLGFIPLASMEINHAIKHGVVCFLKRQGEFQVGLLSGVTPNRNLLVHPKTGQFLMGYVPAVLRRYPFQLLNNDKNEQVLCIWDSEENFKKEQGQAILDDDGELTEHGQKLITFLRQLEDGMRLSAKLSKALADAGVLVPLPIQSKSPEDGEVTPLREDIYWVDQDRLAALDGTLMQAWVRTGVMAFVYAHLASMDHMPKMTLLAENYHKVLDNMDQSKVDFDKLFEESDDEVLKFD